MLDLSLSFTTCFVEIGSSARPFSGHSNPVGGDGSKERVLPARGERAGHPRGATPPHAGWCSREGVLELQSRQVLAASLRGMPSCR